MKDKKVIFITNEILPSGVKILQDYGFIVNFPKISKGPIARAELFSEALNSDGIITMLNDQIDSEFLSKNKHLKIIANYAVGFNNIDIETARDLKIAVTNTPLVLTDATAEVAVGLIIATARNFRSAELILRSGGFTHFEPMGFLGQSLTNKTLGIIGLGRIGLKVAEIMKHAFNCQIIYTSNKSENSIGRKVELDELLKSSDIISIHAPSNLQTKNMIGKNEFKLMKKNAIIINTARGDIVDHYELFNALKNKEIFGAGLDVTHPEPLNLDHPLFSLDNCYILPHIGSANNETREKMSVLCAQNIINVFEGKNPITSVY
jgi:glyoxylate reductase